MKSSHILVILLSITSFCFGQSAIGSNLKFMDDLKEFYTDGGTIWKTTYYNDTLEIDIPNDGLYYMTRVTDKHYVFPGFPGYGIKFITEEADAKIIRIDNYYPSETQIKITTDHNKYLSSAAPKIDTVEVVIEGGTTALKEMTFEDATKHGWTILGYAFASSSPEEVKKLIDAGANAGFVGKHKGMDFFLLRALDDFGIEDFNKKIELYIYGLAKVNLLKEKSFDVYKLALQSNDVESLKRLDKSGLDVNATKQRTGESVLTYAIARNSSAIVEHLINIGANVNHATK